MALVIGNDSYAALGADEQLQKAVNDANAVGDALETIGFEVARGENLTRAEMLLALITTAGKLEEGDIALFFFAGHGVAIDGANYLLPSDVPPADAGAESLVKLSAVSEATVVQTLRERGVRIAAVILDACRDNPFARGGTRAFGDAARGLSRSAALETRGVFGLYSAGFGEQALDRLGDDDDDPNSVFTRVLVPALTTPGQSLLDIAYTVNAEVVRLAGTVGHEQSPAYYDQARAREVFLAGRATQAETRAPPQGGDLGNGMASPSCASARLHFESARELDSVDALEDHVARFGHCEFAALARMLIGRAAATGGVEVAAASPTEYAGTPAAALDPGAVANALTEALTGGGAVQETLDAFLRGILNLSLGRVVARFESVERAGPDVVISGLTLRPTGSASAVTFRRTIIEQPDVTAEGNLRSARIIFLDGAFEGSDSTLGRFEITEFATVSRLMAGPGASSVGYVFGAMDAHDLKIASGGKVFAFLERAWLAAERFVGDTPQETSGAITRFRIEKAALGGPSAIFAAMGYDGITFDLSWAAERRPARDGLTIRDLTVSMREGGGLSLSAELNAIPVLQVLGNGLALPPELEIVSASARYSDSGLAAPLLDALGSQTGEARSAYARRIALQAFAWLLPDSALERDLDTEMSIFGVLPRGLDITLAPPTPVTLAELLQPPGAARKGLARRIGLSIAANPPR